MLSGLMFSSAPFPDLEMVVILGSKEWARSESEAVVGDCDGRRDDLEVECAVDIIATQVLVLLFAADLLLLPDWIELS